jgi:anthranilate phosphoribosyltransferase
MDMKQAIHAVTERRDLTSEEMIEVMHLIMGGDATQAQIGAFLIGLRMKGETVEEIAAAATVMRELALRVRVDVSHLVDTCGTGGDAAGTFNISTASAFVAAAAGARVAKHGNRSVSSKSGSADVLEAAGVKLDINAEQAARCIEAVGLGFLFAPTHHGAMRHAIGPRREMGVRTIFNLLGPLTNPASAPNQVIGVFASEWVGKLAQVMQRLGSHHVLVVNAEDGMDEISIAGRTSVAELRNGEIEQYSIAPEEFGFERADLRTLRVESAAESLAMVRAVLSNTPGPARDIVALNAGAAIYAADVVSTLAEGIDLAVAALASGRAAGKLEALVACTNA